MRKGIWILWPSFVAGGAGTVLLFTALDPHELGFASRLGAYTVGFFFLWALAAASSAFTCFLQRSFPKREDPDAIG